MLYCIARCLCCMHPYDGHVCMILCRAAAPLSNYFGLRLLCLNKEALPASAARFWFVKSAKSNLLDSRRAIYTRLHTSLKAASRTRHDIRSPFCRRCIHDKKIIELPWHTQCFTGECLQETTPGRAQRHAEGVDAVDDSGRGGEAWSHAIMGQTRGEDPQTFVRPARGTSPAAWRKCGIALIVANTTSVALTERFWATSACCCIVPQLTLKLEGAGGAGEASAGEATAFPISDSQPQKVPQQCCSEKRPSRQRLATCDAQSTMHLVGG